MTSEDRPTLRREERPNGIVVVSISGELDTASTRTIEGDFSRAVGENRSASLVLDLSGVRFMTSAALAMVIVYAQSIHRAGGKMALACLQPLVEEVFERAGFLSLFSTYPTLEDALLALE